MRVAVHFILIVQLMVAVAGCASRHNAAGCETALSITQDTAASMPHISAAATPQRSGSDAPAHRDPATPSLEPWQFGEFPGYIVSTANYRVYTTLTNARMLDLLPDFYERALNHYTTALADLPRPTRPLRTYLFQNRRQWQAKTEELLPDQAEMFANLGRGGFTTRGTSVLYYIDRYSFPYDTLAIAAHEGWHQYTQQTFKHQLPVWLEEGIATYMEGFRRNDDGVLVFMPAANRERQETLRRAVRRGNLIPLNDLLTRTPQSFLGSSKDTLLVYYAQVWALTNFLAEGENGRYRAALAEVLTDAAEGRLVGRLAASTTVVTATGRRRGISVLSTVGPAVAQEYFNHDLRELEQQYLAYVDDLLERTSRRRARSEQH